MTDHPRSLDHPGSADHPGGTDQTRDLDHLADPDHRSESGAPHHTRLPDYDLADALEFTRPQQYRALFEETRLQIISALSERAATTSELAEALGKPKGTIGYHLNVLADAGLVQVVRTKKVRALEAKYYGRTARVFWYDRIAEGAGAAERAIGTAASEIAQVPPERADQVTGYIRHARVPEERAREFSKRLVDLLMEFSEEPRDGQTTYGLAVALYPTARRPLTASEESAEAATDPPPSHQRPDL